MAIGEIKEINIFSQNQIISKIKVGLSAETDELTLLLADYRNVFIVADKNAADKSSYIQKLKECRNDIPVLEICASEQMKTMDTVLGICKWLLEQGADRDALMLGIGGGIILDMTGFAASIYKRGVRFAYVPTTLLAQVDAGIGGKTGVNFDNFKNILGVIRQPEFSYLNVSVLSSLTKRDFLSGAAEMLKTFIIENNENHYGRALSFIREYIAEFGNDTSDGGFSFSEDQKTELLSLVAASASVKAGVVSRDQYESGERRLLNLGHTFAHAIETLSRRQVAGKVSGNWDISHGEAVAIGIVQAARLAEALVQANKCCFGAEIVVEQNFANRLETEFRLCGLPVDCPFGIREMAPVMAKDKKAEGGIVHFILPLSVGKVIAYDLSVNDVVELLG